MEELLNELMKTKELIEGMTKEFLIKFSIAAKPETDLVSCLMALSKEGLINIAFLHIEELNIDDDKEKIVNDLVDIIKTNFVKDLDYFLASDLSFINDCILANSEPFEYKGDAVTNLSEYGYAFSFYYKEQFYGIMPKELVKIFLKVDKEALEKKVNLNEELMKYAYALTNLYGAYLSEQYVTVWNVHHKEKITCEFAEDFLERASLKQYVFWASGDLIASCTLEDEDEEYEYILEEAKTHGYYMPTKSDITFISENEYDESSIAFKKVKQYIEEKELSELITDDALFEIENSCLFDVKFKELLADLVEIGVTFEGLEDIQAFADLYMHLSSDTRKWILGGNKPNQLFDSNNNPFNDFNNRKIPITPQKVGRNDPCPCGSGKKYKKCCMDS